MRGLGENGLDLTTPSTRGEPARSGREAVEVLYIAGMGRSGSTLLCRTLGSVDGFIATGELMRIIGRGLGNGDLCGCGVPVGRCELWSAVMREVDRRSPGLDLARLEETRRRITEGWDFLRFLFLPRVAAGFWSDVDGYRRFLTTLYRSIRAVTGARVIVDASKNVFFAKLLTETPGVRVSFVHLVRDSRGVAHSLRRRQQRPGTNGRLEYFRQHGTFVGTLFWSGANLMTEWLRDRVAHFVRVRYEDFVADPSGTIERIVGELNPARAAPLAHVNGTSVRLGIDHVIASNPNRARRGEIELHEDLAWRREMSVPRRWLTTGLTLPLLRRYRYPMVPPPVDGSAGMRAIVTGQPEP